MGPVYTAGATVPPSKSRWPLFPAPVYYDLNADNQQEANEPGIAGVTLYLMDADGNHVLDANGNPIFATTDSAGNYSFTDLTPGTYGVQEIQPGGYVSVGDTPGMVNGAQDGQVIDVDNLGSINLGYGDDSVGNNFAETKYASISGYVYYDANNNGVMDPGETGIAGAAVTVTNVFQPAPAPT